jgi:hypothetical protein
MKTTFKKSLITTSLLTGLVGATSSHAFTVNETSDFSDTLGQGDTSSINMPGITVLNGSLTTNDIDNFEIQALPTGIQLIEFSVDLIGATSNISVQIYEDGNPPDLFDTRFFTDSMSSYMTSGTFAGALRFEIIHGDESGGTGAYSINLPAAPVPVPAAALLFASGLGALGAAKARRKAKRRT